MKELGFLGLRNLLGGRLLPAAEAVRRADGKLRAEKQSQLHRTLLQTLRGVAQEQGGERPSLDRAVTPSLVERHASGHARANDVARVQGASRVVFGRDHREHLLDGN